MKTCHSLAAILAVSSMLAIGLGVGSPAAAVLSCNGISTNIITDNGPGDTDSRARVIVTGNGNDTIVGTSARDVIRSGGGNDTICSLGGNDDIRTGNGRDVVFAGTGKDRVYGERGADELHGDSGRDTIVGGNGADVIYGDAGNDTLKGGFGDDTIYGGGGKDRIFGEDGEDTVYGEGGNDTIDAGADDDLVYGGNNNDVIHGGSGTNDLFGELGTDTITGEPHSCLAMAVPSNVPILSPGQTVSGSTTALAAQTGVRGERVVLLGYVWVPDGWKLSTSGSVTAYDSDPGHSLIYVMSDNTRIHYQTAGVAHSYGPKIHNGSYTGYSGQAVFSGLANISDPHGAGSFILVGMDAWRVPAWDYAITVDVVDTASPSPWVDQPSCVSRMPADLTVDNPLIGTNNDIPLVAAAQGVVEMSSEVVSMVVPFSACGDMYDDYVAAGVGNIDVADGVYCAIDFWGPGVGNSPSPRIPTESLDLANAASKGTIYFWNSDGEAILRVEDVIDSILDDFLP